jgi:hypothetical protein
MIQPISNFPIGGYDISLEVRYADLSDVTPLARSITAKTATAATLAHATTVFAR